MSADFEIAGLHCRFLAGASATAPLLYLVHGRAGTIDVMWAFKRCFPGSFNVVAVQAPQADAIGGFSWWQVEPKPEGLAAAVAACRTFLRFSDTFEQDKALRPTYRLGLGFSQGAALLSLALQEKPEYFHGIGLLAGFVLEHPQNDTFLKSEKKPEIFMAHGTEDSVVPMDRALAGHHLLESWGCEVDFYEDAVAHKIGSSAMRGLKEWLHSFAG